MESGSRIEAGPFSAGATNRGGKVPFQRAVTTASTGDCHDLGATMVSGDNKWEELGTKMTSAIVNTENHSTHPHQVERIAETMPQRTNRKQTHKTMIPVSGIVDKDSKRPHPQQLEPTSGTQAQRNNIQPTQLKVPHPIVPSPTSKVKTFMQSRPGGQLEKRNGEMRGLERRMSSQIQKKGSTSTQGRKALEEVTKIVAYNNKDNEATDTTGNKRKDRGERAILITPIKKPRKRGQKKATKKKSVKSDHAINGKKVMPVIKCKYGCRHGGLLELVQMIPMYTKYHLERGNYFDDKQCKDCNESIGDLFGKSKGKAIFYYCHIDNKVADFSDDEQEMETTACACTLCLMCYYNRDKKKKIGFWQINQIIRKVPRIETKPL